MQSARALHALTESTGRGSLTSNNNSAVQRFAPCFPPTCDNLRLARRWPTNPSDVLSSNTEAADNEHDAPNDVQYLDVSARFAPSSCKRTTGLQRPRTCTMATTVLDDGASAQRRRGHLEHAVCGRVHAIPPGFQPCTNPWAHARCPAGADTVTAALTGRGPTPKTRAVRD